MADNDTPADQPHQDNVPDEAKPDRTDSANTPAERKAGTPSEKGAPVPPGYHNALISAANRFLRQEQTLHDKLREKFFWQLITIATIAQSAETGIGDRRA